MNVITVTLNPCIDETVELQELCLGETNRAEEIRRDVGGKGINVSKILRSFGIPSVATGILAGEKGRYIERNLQTEGIESRFVFTLGETRTNFKIFDQSKGLMTEINAPGANVGNAYDKFRSMLISMLPHCDVLVLSGSVPSDIGDAVYHELTKLAKSYGVKVILDADGEKMRRGLEACPFAIKPNRPEFERIVGRELRDIDEIIAEARKIADGGVEMVVVSLGGEGAVFVRDELVVRTKSLPVQVKSAAGAGDAMVGTLIYAMKKKYPLTETAKLMTAAGSITVAKAGTQVATFGEVAANYERVETKVLFF
ncbi:MAG: 1-phosphofructokinase [Oscillospiraceae bacterium]|nr:1-phosphofructokinase [Oscillospiraceae bacterium]